MNFIYSLALNISRNISRNILLSEAKFSLFFYIPSKVNQTELKMKTAIIALSIIGTLIAHVTAEFNLRTLIGGALRQNGKDCLTKFN